MTPITSPMLAGKHIRLEILARQHYAALKQAADDERLWQFTVARAFGPYFDAWWEDAQAAERAGTRIPFAVITQHDDAPIGSTSYLNVALADRRLEIGHTWYAHRYWASAVNPECKLLMMKHAFEALEIRRVEFCVDAINERSRAAVTKLGAVQEGILRSHRITQTGRIRDTVYYSVLDTEWPAAKERLAKRLAIHNGAAPLRADPEVQARSVLNRA